MYGEIDPEGYLQRFIDLALALPRPRHTNFAKFLANRFFLRDVLDDDGQDQLIRAFSSQAKALDLSLRTQEQCFTTINVMLRSGPELGPHDAAISAFLATLRAARPEAYEPLRSPGYSLTGKHIEEAEKVLRMPTELGDYVRAALRFSFLSRGDLDHWLEQMDSSQRHRTGSQPVPQLELARRHYEVARPQRSSAKQLVDRLEQLDHQLDKSE